MKKKNGFVSISIIYSFFIVFLLIMLAMLAAYTNKRYLKDRMGDNLPKESPCREGDSLYSCIINTEASKAEIPPKDYRNSEEIVLTIEEITDDTVESGMFATQDDYTRVTGNNSLYYRGNVNNNYVVFGDYVWRIVRINGDDSTRLIYQGEYNKNAEDDQSKVKGNDYITSTGSFGIVSKTKYNMGSGAEAACSIQEAAYSTTQEIRENLSGGGDCQTCIRNCDSSYNSAKDACGILDLKCKAGAFRNYSNCKNECSANGSCSWLENINESIKVSIDKAFENLENFQKDLGAETCENSGQVVGAHLLHNIGYMNNKTANLVRYDSKYDNQNKSTVQEYIDTWFENNIQSLRADYLSDDTIFCGDKNRTKCTMTKSGEKWGENCSSNEDEEGNESFLDRIGNGVNNLYEKTERYYYSGWERVIEKDSASLVCPDSGSIATKAENKVLNLNRYNVNNDKYLLYANNKYLLYANNKLSKGTSYSEKNESIDVTVNTIYSNGKFALGILSKESYNQSKVNLKGLTYNTTLEYLGNGDLSYPIGLLSADEVIYAGLNYDGSTESYLVDHSKNDNFYWTMTLAYTDYASINGRMGANYFAFGRKTDGGDLLALVNDYPKDTGVSDWLTKVVTEDGEKNIFVNESGSGAYMRPVVNLKNQVIYCSGKGTENDPYTIGTRVYNDSGIYIGNTCL